METRYRSPITRYYVDTRDLAASNLKIKFDLPLLNTLPPDDQDRITAYIRAHDRCMSLASALLKHVFIHRTARIPWNQVYVKRTPKPHGRPYWQPPTHWDDDFGLEFNVSHQAGLIALIGCKTPRSVTNGPPLDIIRSAVYHGPRLGVDVACTKEDKRTPNDITTDDKFAEWVDIFAEMFSEKERAEMKTTVLNDMDAFPTSITHQMGYHSRFEAMMRRFYAYWALKEAYIKMMGEGLLASWLRELEFSRVMCPPLPTGDEHTTDEKGKWSADEEAQTQHDFGISFQGTKIEDVQMTLEAYGNDFLFATAMRGVEEDKPRGDPETRWKKLDIEKDIRPCAEGTCQCL